jgi:mono/diheme cytochrome c family protein
MKQRFWRCRRVDDAASEAAGGRWTVKKTPCILAATVTILFAFGISVQGQSKSASGDAAKGNIIFQQKCAVCHNDGSDAKKVGPGLKGLNKRGKFSVNNGAKITNESLKSWIENGDSLMPPMKEVLDGEQIRNVVAYVRTL